MTDLLKDSLLLLCIELNIRASVVLARREEVQEPGLCFDVDLVYHQLVYSVYLAVQVLVHLFKLVIISS